VLAIVVFARFLFGAGLYGETEGIRPCKLCRFCFIVISIAIMTILMMVMGIRGCILRSFCSTWCYMMNDRGRTMKTAHNNIIKLILFLFMPFAVQALFAAFGEMPDALRFIFVSLRSTPRGVFPLCFFSKVVC
jgi:hypothetical protein